MNREILWKTGAVLSLIGLIVAGMILGIWLRHRQIPVSPHVTVVFPDVGDGDCTFIQTADHKNILIDAGDTNAGPTVVRMLRNLDVQRIDLLILAAPDEKHIGGISAILANHIPIEAVWDNTKDEQDHTYSLILQKIRLRHIPSRTVHANEGILFGKSPIQLSVLWPPEHGPRSQQDSLVFRLDYQNTAFLLLGAADSDAEQYLISGASTKLQCEDKYGILQVIGHGDGSGTSPELLRWSTPELAVIQSSAANPAAEITLHRLQAAGVSVWRTDRQGTITITTNGHSPPVVTPTQM
jgi:competence protein ComEC